MSTLHLVEAIQGALDAERTREHDRDMADREKRSEENDRKRDRMHERELLALELLAHAFTRIAEELGRIRCDGISVRR